MHDELQARADELWEFSCNTYARQGVAPACLLLQDTYDLDVNVLLFCLYAGSRGYVLSTRDLLCIQAQVDPWRKNVIQALRAARRFLKGGEPPPGRLGEELAKEILASELKAERHEQYLIVGSVAALEQAVDDAAAARNLATYLRTVGTPLNHESTDVLATLLSAATSVSARDATLMLRKAEAAGRSLPDADKAG